MARFGLIPVFLREIFGKPSLPREPEPDLVMNGPEQVAAFVTAGRIDGVLAASYLFNAAHISQAIQGCHTVVDLACGPATQLALVAQLNPNISFIGVDLSPGMLANAEAHIREMGLTNVRFQHEDAALLSGLADQSVDGVISTLALHHLPSVDLLRSCFQQIRRILRPNGAVFLVDLGRLKSLKSVIYFAYMNAQDLPHIFMLDYERSLRAAFLREDFALVAQECLPDVEVLSTSPIPVLLICKTQDKFLPDALRELLADMRRRLPRRARGDLDIIRFLSRLGGLQGDPFR